MYTENKEKKERGRWREGEKERNHEREPGTKWGPKVSLPLTGMERKRKKNKNTLDLDRQALLIQKGRDGLDLVDRQRRAF